MILLTNYGTVQVKILPEEPIYESRPNRDITEDDLLSRLQRLSIKAQNKLVNIVEFLSLTQDVDETVAMFLSRLKGQVSVLCLP